MLTNSLSNVRITAAVDVPTLNHVKPKNETLPEYWELRFNLRTFVNGLPFLNVYGFRVQWDGFINPPKVLKGKQMVPLASVGFNLYQLIYEIVEQLPEYQEALKDGLIAPLKPVEQHTMYTTDLELSTNPVDQRIGPPDIGLMDSPVSPRARAKRAQKKPEPAKAKADGDGNWCLDHECGFKNHEDFERHKQAGCRLAWKT
jgi:hypothetical protein